MSLPTTTSSPRISSTLRFRLPGAWADRLGVAASAGCVLHCLLTPVLLSCSTVLAHVLPSEEITHRVLAVVVASLGAFALLRGLRQHRKWRVAVLMGCGLLLVAAAAVMGDRLPSHGTEVLVTGCGSALMITAHRLNHTFCARCPCASDAGTPVRVVALESRTGEIACRK